MPTAPAADASIGIDFGTSNTVVAIATPGEAARIVTFDHRGRILNGFVSALCFWDERRGGSATTRVEGGPWAIDQLVDGSFALRFIQSFKTFAASSTFQDTRIFREKYRFEDLLVTFLRNLTRHAGTPLDLASARVVIGRPVKFAGQNPNDGLAMQRYHTAFAEAGVGAASYVFEPVGAAFFYARALQRDATVLVADFGGGTSDFSVMRFERAGGQLRAQPLGHAGIGIAGDVFDTRIVDHVVSPRLGKGSSYRSFDKELAIPNHYYANLSRWHQLAMMKANGDLKGLRDLAKAALKPEQLDTFADIIEFDMGFALYRAVSDAKFALSSRDETQFRFAVHDTEIGARVTRRDFESWIAADVARIAGTVDEVLRRAGTAEGEIERVFLTGGTSLVPAIRRLFAERFGEERLTNTDQFESIAAGLAMIGQEADVGRWAVPSGQHG
ncbi:Hsp70 family protein [Labrys wisconsinensis]|uniref:Chaperone protein n=1 Tax=Labrys wisconsinensis TaxID=425677 RepID=A0ABU0J418_9HYPH|nr:Hsp70 family protein [Labrys wisconsinensis]MDQ0468979.1 putative chaperone protein [Labrys wisconsinensis]